MIIKNKVKKIKKEKLNLDLLMPYLPLVTIYLPAVADICLCVLNFVTFQCLVILLHL
jgi:hypothetical protein